MPAKRGGSSGYTRGRGSGSASGGGGNEGLGTSRSLTGSNPPTGIGIDRSLTGRAVEGGNRIGVNATVTTQSQSSSASSRVTPSQAYSTYDRMERVADRVRDMDEGDIVRAGRNGLTIDFGGSKGKVTIKKEGRDKYTVREHKTGTVSTASYPRAAFQKASKLPKPKTQPLKSDSDIKRGEGVWYKGRAYKFVGISQNAYSGERTFRIERDALRGGRRETEWIPLSRMSSVQKIVGV